MTADTECAVRDVLATGLIMHECAVMPGVSGAPFLVGTGQDVKVAGFHVATAGPAGSISAFAVPVSSFAQQASSPSHKNRDKL
jgi:hypothetical protein